MEPNHEMTPESYVPGGPERLTSKPATPEQQNASLATPERTTYQESRERVTGSSVGDSSSFQAPPPPLNVTPAVQTSSDSPVKAAPIKDDENPLVADDVDVIEKEWVDRAKKILNDTKDDPYRKEHEVSRLQADYLEKRFGIQVKLPQG